MPPEARSDVLAISAGPFSSLALLGNGKVVAWGLDVDNNVPSNLSNVIGISCGYHALALQKLGESQPHAIRVAADLPITFSSYTSIVLSRFPAD